MVFGQSGLGPLGNRTAGLLIRSRSRPIRSSVPFGHDGIDDLLRQLRFFSEGLSGGVFPLSDQFAVELQPGTLLLDHTHLDAYVQNAPLFVDAVIVDDLEFRLSERR